MLLRLGPGGEHGAQVLNPRVCRGRLLAGVTTDEVCDGLDLGRAEHSLKRKHWPLPACHDLNDDILRRLRGIEVGADRAPCGGGCERVAFAQPAPLKMPLPSLALTSPRTPAPRSDARAS
jgi:hypothetical protein